MVDPAEILEGWSEFAVTPPTEFFLNCLRAVRDATALNGAPAYQPDTVTQLVTTIASRGHGPLLFRTVHLMAAAAMTGMRPDQLLVTDQPLTPRLARRLLMDTDMARPDTLHADGDALAFVEPASGSIVFKLGSGQVPLAAACLEFIIEALGFSVIDDAFSALASDHGTSGRKAVTKDLSSRLYHFLGEHLPQVAERNMARTLADYLQAETGQTAFSAEDIDDRLILEFWREKSLDEALSFKLFGTAAKAWLGFRDCLIRSHGDGFGAAVSLNPVYEDEDFDRLSHLAVGVAANDDHETGLTALDQLVGDEATPSTWLADLQRAPCSDIKFLTKTELAQLSVPALAGNDGGGLVLTCLRLAAFGPLQNRLVQASRGGTLGHGDIAGILAELDVNAYDDLIAEWRALLETVRNIATTAFLRLWEAGDPVIFEYLSQNGDDETRREMARIASGLTGQFTDAETGKIAVEPLADRMLETIESLPPENPIAAARQQMKRTAQAYRRQGLRSSDARADGAAHESTGEAGSEGHRTQTGVTDRLHALAFGGDRLLRLSAFLEVMSHPKFPVGSAIRDDLQIFSQQFFTLHEAAA